MMKLALVSALVASASAFSPSMQKQSSFALSASPYENEIGVQVPVSFRRTPGYFLTPYPILTIKIIHNSPLLFQQTGFFDPMGFLNDVPKEGFDNLREIEM